jgi:FMN phosphatase YigB (HAD superfamily)
MKNSQYKDKVIVFDFDGTITTSQYHLHNYLAEKKFDSFSKSPNDLIINGVTSQKNESYNPLKVMEAIKRLINPGNEFEEVEIFRSKNFASNMRELISKGAKVAIASFNQYPDAITECLKHLGFTVEEITNINIICGGEALGKIAHLEKIKELTHVKNNSDIILVDDSKTNCEIAKNAGYNSYHITKYASLPNEFFSNAVDNNWSKQSFREIKFEEGNFVAITKGGKKLGPEGNFEEETKPYSFEQQVQLNNSYKVSNSTQKIPCWEPNNFNQQTFTFKPLTHFNHFSGQNVTKNSYYSSFNTTQQQLIEENSNKTTSSPLLEEQVVVPHNGYDHTRSMSFISLDNNPTNKDGNKKRSVENTNHSKDPWAKKPMWEHNNASSLDSFSTGISCEFISITINPNEKKEEDVHTSGEIDLDN